MKRAIEIELKILEEDLFLAEAEDISGGERFHLGIGVDISCSRQWNRFGP